MGDAILRIPRDARVRAYRTRDKYDGVVPATSKRQPYCHSSYIELSGRNVFDRSMACFYVMAIMDWVHNTAYGMYLVHA